MPSHDEVKQLIEDAGGKVTEQGPILPDGNTFAVASFPLRKDHWIYQKDPVFDAPPMPFKMGGKDMASVLIQSPTSDMPFGMVQRSGMNKRDFAEKIKEAGKYAIRASTMHGKEMDFDPDAMLQNLVVGMLGYWTNDGLDGQDDWANPVKFRKKE